LPRTGRPNKKPKVPIPHGLKDKNKIVLELDCKQLDEFLARLHALPGKKRSLGGIQDLAREYGIDISLCSAKNFKNRTYRAYVDRMEKAREIAEAIEAVGAHNVGMTLADAGAALLSQQLFEQILEATSGQNQDVLLDIDKVSLAISRIRTGDVQARGMQAKLEDLQRKWEERDARKELLQKQLEALRSQGKGSLSVETLQEIEESLALL
jgi:hypothetical protein